MTDEMRKLRNELAMRLWQDGRNAIPLNERPCVFQDADDFIAELEKQDAEESKPTADEIAAAEKRGYLKGLRVARDSLSVAVPPYVFDSLISSAQQGEKEDK